MPFKPEHESFLNRLEDLNLDAAQLIVQTTGKGRTRVPYYQPPTPDTIKKTRDIIAALFAFDQNPTEESFAKVQSTLKNLNLKAVRIKNAPEWLYVTPNAEIGTKLWLQYGRKAQFTMSWHVGSNSRIAISDEHEGGDGTFRAVGQLVEQGTNIKLTFSNLLHRGVSKKVNGRFQADFAHSKATIAYPIMGDLARRRFSIINAHGMASKANGLFVNNYNSNFVKGRPSLPTLVAIAQVRYFHDNRNKEFAIGGVVPGSAVIRGIRYPLSPPNNARTSFSSLFTRPKGVHNTNVIGNQTNAIRTQMDRLSRGDSGNSLHIEFGDIRSGKATLRKMIDAINTAAGWMMFLEDHPELDLNPWKVVNRDPNFDMMKYGDLFDVSPANKSRMAAIMANNSPLPSAFISRSEDDRDDIDLNPNDPEYKFDHETDANQPDSPNYDGETIVYPEDEEYNENEAEPRLSIDNLQTDLRLIDGAINAAKEDASDSNVRTQRVSPSLQQARKNVQEAIKMAAGINPELEPTEYTTALEQAKLVIKEYEMQASLYINSVQAATGIARAPRSPMLPSGGPSGDKRTPAKAEAPSTGKRARTLAPS